MTENHRVTQSISAIATGHWQLELESQDFWLSQGLFRWLAPSTKPLSFAGFLDQLEPGSRQQLETLLQNSDWLQNALNLRFLSADHQYHCQLERMSGARPLIAARLERLPTTELTERIPKQGRLPHNLDRVSGGAAFFDAEQQVLLAIQLLAEQLQVERIEMYRPGQEILAYGTPLASATQAETYRQWSEQEQVLSYQINWPDDCFPLDLDTAAVPCAIFPVNLAYQADEVQGLLVLYQLQGSTINAYQLQFVKITLSWLEAMLEQQAKLEDLLSLNKNTEQILNILSHDLRNSLSSVIGLSQLLKRRSWVTEPGLDLLDRIQQAGKNSHKLLQEMLTVQELEADEKGEHLYRLELSSLVKQVVETYTAQIREQEISLETDLIQGKVQLPLHKSWFRRLIDNLLSNALKFTLRGGQVLLKIERQDQELLISVKDTGVGIPLELQQHIFKRFSPARRIGLQGERSTGLGLYLVHQIVELHQGEIGFESKEGQGTRFWIRLPLK